MHAQYDEITARMQVAHDAELLQARRESMQIREDSARLLDEMRTESTRQVAQMRREADDAIRDLSTRLQQADCTARTNFHAISTTSVPHTTVRLHSNESEAPKAASNRDAVFTSTRMPPTAPSERSSILDSSTGEQTLENEDRAQDERISTPSRRPTPNLVHIGDCVYSIKPDGTAIPVIVQSSVSNAAAANMPKKAAKPPFRFDGDSSMFHVWMTNFEMCAAAQNLTDSQRMQAMPGYMDGSVQLALGYDTQRLGRHCTLSSRKNENDAALRRTRPRIHRRVT